jgi:hypothetical protein
MYKELGMSKIKDLAMGIGMAILFYCVLYFFMIFDVIG